MVFSKHWQFIPTTRGYLTSCLHLNHTLNIQTSNNIFCITVHSVPVPCPFQGFYTFTYSNSTTTASKHCKNPISEILPCADDSKFKFAYRHCRNMPETFDKGKYPKKFPKCHRNYNIYNMMTQSSCINSLASTVTFYESYKLLKMFPLEIQLQANII